MRLLLASIFVGCGGNITTKVTDTSDSAGEPSAQPTDEPSTQPSSEPGQPSSEPSTQPSSEPSQPSSEPSQPSSEPSGEPVEADDYTQTGPYTVNSTSSSISATGCDNGMSYTAFAPQGVSNPVTVVLAHGFLRGGSLGVHTMTGWGEHYASWGVEVLVPVLCHYSLTGADHEMNGQNMIELADAHGATQVIYAGQSAGGLASVIAAAQDSDALGVIGLDATDTDGMFSDPIGQGYAGSVSQPAFALVAEPSSCNSENNGVTLFEMMNNAQALRVTSSDHCDYENPTDWGCEAVCLNQSTSFDDAQIGTAVAQLSTAAILALTGDADAGAAWTDSALSEWIDSGLIDRLR